MVPPIDVLLFDPESFFDRERSGWSGPAAVLATLAVVQLLAVYPLYQMTQQLYANIAGSSMIVMGTLVGGLIGPLVGVLLFWGLVAATAHGISALFDGEGSVGETARAVSWGFVPHVFGTIVAVAAIFLRYFQTSIEPLPAEVTQQQLQTAQTQISGTPTEPLNLLVTVVGLLTLLWGGYLWTIGVERARSVDRRQAAIAVAPWIVLAALATAANVVLL